MRELLRKRAAEGDEKAAEDLGEVAGPEICDEALLYFQAFQRLAASRRVGMGVGPIPISEVLSFVAYFRIDSDFERERLLHFVGLSDGVYLEEVHKRSEKSERKADPPKPRKRGFFRRR